MNEELAQKLIQSCHVLVPAQPIVKIPEKFFATGSSSEEEEEEEESGEYDEVTRFDESNKTAQLTMIVETL